MKLSDFRKLIKGLPGDMELMMPTVSDGLITVCKEQSEVREYEVVVDEETGETENVEILFLSPCTCTKEIDPDDLTMHQNLN